MHNGITGPEEGTALHWHGLLQTDSPWEDGVPAVQQCPIAPGKSLRYTFKADLYGTSWYHSHYSAQYAGGLFGPMVIYGPKNAEYDIDLGPVLLTDYFHKPYFQIVEEVMGTDLTLVAPKSDNNLINGKMDYNCSLVTDGTPCVDNAGLAKFRFQTGKKHRLRLINASAEGIQKFSIDGHKMTIIANDFVPIVPYETEIVTLGVGQRSDVIVEASGSAREAYWMRSTISNCSNTLQPDAQAIIYYPDAKREEKPTTTAWVDNTAECANVSLVVLSPLILKWLLRFNAGPLTPNNTILPPHPRHPPRHNHHPRHILHDKQHRQLPLDHKQQLLPRRLQLPPPPTIKSGKHILPALPRMERLQHRLQLHNPLHRQQPNGRSAPDALARAQHVHSGRRGWGMGRQDGRKSWKPAEEGRAASAAAGVYGCADRRGEPGGVAVSLSYRLACYGGALCECYGEMFGD